MDQVGDVGRASISISVPYYRHVSECIREVIAAAAAALRLENLHFHYDLHE